MTGNLGHAIGLNLPRVVLPEVLDGLAAEDASAQRSRRDLQRVHRVMGTRAMLLRALRTLPLVRPRSAWSTPLRVLELGAGDGSLMLGVARSLQGQWPPVALTLLDRQPLLTAATVAGYAQVGWTATAEVGDALAWAARVNATDDATATNATNATNATIGATATTGATGASASLGATATATATAESQRPAPPAAPHWDLIVANLFLHHFKNAELLALLAAVAGSSAHFVACEPRRAWLAWAGSHLVGVLGANAVTREDAVLSVHAGFRNQELRALWCTSRVSPASGAVWSISETAAGLFSHCFVASRAAGAGLETH